MAVEPYIPTAVPPAASRLTAIECAEVCLRLGREPTPIESRMFEVMWSEHCAYKYSRLALRRLPSRGPGLVLGPGENAGVVSIGDGWAAVFKMESHNHPSAIVPFHGAATGVGGIIRDILAMGARPIALLDSLRFGPPDDPHAAALFRGVVSGIASYGNSVGVPTVGGELGFAPCYLDNPIVNVACLGIVREDAVATSRAAGPGNAVVYLGAGTGRDGINGAAFASAELAGRLEDRSAVQMGDPFTGKLLIEATLEALASGTVVAIQDMGAAGLTCALSEMSARGRVGMDVDLGLVPRREDGMTPEEVLLSESQERMLLVVRAGAEDAVLDAARRWSLPAAVIGRVVASPVLSVRDGDRTVVEIDPRALTEAPMYASEAAAPCGLNEGRPIDPVEFPSIPPEDALRALLSSPPIRSARRVFQQYDHMIQTNTVVAPGADADVLRIKEAPPRGLALAVDGTTHYSHLDPYAGGLFAVLEAAQNLACVGARPCAVTDCLNFASPERPAVLWAFRQAVEGIARACELLDVPVVGGNVSFYNEAGQGITPTPIVAMLGRLDDVRRHATPGWKRAGDLVVLIGNGPVSLDGSEYLATLHHLVAGRIPEPDLVATLRVHECTREAIDLGLLASAHDCGSGGIATALAECCLLSGMGAAIGLRQSDASAPLLLFGEGIGRIIASLRPASMPALLALARRLSVPVQVIGSTGDVRLVIGMDGLPPSLHTRAGDPWIDVTVRDMAGWWEDVP
jgi:phosphoribosylformylglycinamidine synthase subunit PurL